MRDVTSVQSTLDNREMQTQTNDYGPTTRFESAVYDSSISRYMRLSCKSAPKFEISILTRGRRNMYEWPYESIDCNWAPSKFRPRFSSIYEQGAFPFRRKIDLNSQLAQGEGQEFSESKKWKHNCQYDYNVFGGHLFTWMLKRRRKLRESTEFIGSIRGW